MRRGLAHDDGMVAELKDPELPPRRRLKRAEYDHLVALGAFDGERIELLYGELVPMSPQGRPHRWLVHTLQESLQALLPKRVAVQTHAPVVADDDSEPEPDVAVFDRAEHRFDRLPSTLYLVIEVADSSRVRDLKVKRRLYAESAFPEYWVFDLVERRLHVHREPRDGDYQEVVVLAPDDGVTVSPSLFPDVVLELAPLFPPA
ncbi:MAG TPA: Uma2 family endonuclease [Myxococcota bacterium]|nr:Uma2 family endonuclease [Myxococcota bacterium]